MRAVAARVLALAFGTVVALGLGEIALRIADPWIGRHSDTMFLIMERDDLLGWHMAPGIEREVDFVDVEGIPVRANSAGFWDDEFGPRSATSSRCRVAFLGDSFTWGLGVRREERFTELLEARGWDAMNFGMPGYGTDQSLLVWREHASRLEPDLVVFTAYQNDFRDNVHDIRYGRPKPFFESGGESALQLRNVPVDDSDFWDHGIFNRVADPYAWAYPGDVVWRRSRLVHWLGKNSNLVRLGYTVWRGRAPGGSGADVADGPPASPELEPERVELEGAARLEHDLLLALVLRLDSEVHSAIGRELTVVVAGDRIPQTRELMSALEERGTSWVDATSPVLAAALGDAGDVYFPYSGHWTPRAHAVVAQGVSDAVEASGACGT